MASKTNEFRIRLCDQVRTRMSLMFVKILIVWKDFVTISAMSPEHTTLNSVRHCVYTSRRYFIQLVIRCSDQWGSHGSLLNRNASIISLSSSVFGTVFVCGSVLLFSVCLTVAEKSPGACLISATFFLAAGHVLKVGPGGGVTGLKEQSEGVTTWSRRLLWV